MLQMLLCAPAGRVTLSTHLTCLALSQLCVEDRLRNAPIISWGKDTVANDAQILMPYCGLGGCSASHLKAPF